MFCISFFPPRSALGYANTQCYLCGSVYFSGRLIAGLLKASSVVLFLVICTDPKAGWLSGLFPRLITEASSRRMFTGLYRQRVSSGAGTSSPNTFPLFLRLTAICLGLGPERDNQSQRLTAGWFRCKTKVRIWMEKEAFDLFYFVRKQTGENPVSLRLLTIMAKLAASSPPASFSPSSHPLCPQLLKAPALMCLWPSQIL